MKTALVNEGKELFKKQYFREAKRSFDDAMRLFPEKESLSISLTISAKKSFRKNKKAIVVQPYYGTDDVVNDILEEMNDFEPYENL